MCVCRGGGGGGGGGVAGLEREVNFKKEGFSP